MEDKYIINTDKFNQNMVLCEGDYHADFCSEKDAQEYCDFKNAEVIDSNVKERILNQLEQLRVDSHCVEIKEGFSEERICSTEFEKAIKIISKLKEK